MRKLIAATIMMFAGVGAQAHSDYELVSSQFTFEAPSITTLEMRWQAGDNPLNQFRIKRVLDAKAWFKPKKPVLFISPFNVTSDHYTLSSTGEYQHSLEAQMALAGYDVWIVEDRVYTEDPALCESEYDCSVVSDWSFDVRFQDIELARHFIYWVTGVKDPVIGGITGGGMVSIALVNEYPQAFRGLFSTGAIYSLDPDTVAKNQMECDNFHALIADGIGYADALFGLTPLVEAAKNDPDGPSFAAPGLTNLQFLVLLLGTPGGLGAASLTPNYSFATGLPDLSDFAYMNKDVFYEDYYYFGGLASNRHFADIVCSIAGDPTYTQWLGDFTGDVLFLGGGAGMALLQQDNATLFVNAASVDVIVDPVDGGEGDNYLVDFEDRQLRLDNPLLDWLDNQY